MKSQASYFESLDILRGIAALLVVFTHGVSRNLWSGYVTGSTGVAIFFSLSGFLMGYLYVNKIFTIDNVYSYCVSRFSRIAPAYLIIIVLSYFIFNFIDSTFIYSIDNSNVLRHLLFSGNVSIFWSIPPEVQFYAFFIMIWFSLHKLRKNAYLPIIFVIMAIVLMFVIRDLVPGTTLPSKFHLFISGCLAGFVRSEFNHIQISHINKILVAIFLIAYGIYLENIDIGVRTYAYIHYCFLCGLAIFILSLKSTQVTNGYISRIFIMIGKISFTLYLFHEVILHYYQYLDLNLSPIVNVLIGFSLSIIVSYYFYKSIEKPLNLKIKQNLLKLLRF